MIIAIDGPAAAGKGTLARRLAEHFGLALLDTGLLYRAVGMNMVRGGADPNDPVLAEAAAKALTPKDLEAEDLRTDAAAAAASRVSAVPGVRAQLLEFQRNFAADPPAAPKGRFSMAATSAPWSAQTPTPSYSSPPPSRSAPKGVLKSCGKGASTLYMAAFSRIWRNATRATETAPSLRWSRPKTPINWIPAIWTPIRFLPRRSASSVPGTVK